MIKVIQSYAVIAVGVKMILLNTPTALAGKQPQVQCVLNTQIGNSLSHNISTIFGSAFFSSLQPLLVEFTMQEDMKDTADTHPADSMKSFDDSVTTATKLNSPPNISNTSDETVQISGYISKAGIGVGRSDSDRQYCYCNGRPVDLSRVVKALNEVRSCSISIKFIQVVLLNRRFGAAMR